MFLQRVGPYVLASAWLFFVSLQMIVPQALCSWWWHYRYEHGTPGDWEFFIYFRYRHVCDTKTILIIGGNDEWWAQRPFIKYTGYATRTYRVVWILKKSPIEKEPDIQERSSSPIRAQRNAIHVEQTQQDSKDTAALLVKATWPLHVVTKIII